MCKYKILFAVLLFSLTIMSLSSCDFIDHVLGDETYDYSSQDYTGYRDYAQSYDNGQTDADNDESKATQVQSSQKDTIFKTADVSVQSVIVENKHNEQDSIIGELNNKIGYLESKNARMIESSTVYALMLFNLLLLIISFLFLYHNITVRKKRNSNSSYNNDEGAITQSVVRLLIENKMIEHNRDINKKNKILEEKIHNLEIKIEKLEMEGDPYASYCASSKHEESQRSSSVSFTADDSYDSSSNPKTFYMPRTMTPLQFEDSKKKISRSENTYFKFVLTKKDQAMFMFDPFDDNCIKRAFDDRDNSLATVCEIELLSSQPRSFKNCENGYAELRNGVWEVTKKLKLQYV